MSVDSIIITNQRDMLKNAIRIKLRNYPSSSPSMVAGGISISSELRSITSS